MQKQIQKDIKILSRAIKLRYKPEKIILFGSLAWGRPSKDSDIDLFVIKKTNKRFGKRIDEVNIIANRTGIISPKDVIVFTPNEVKERLDLEDFFVQDIINKGKVLYAK